jgi:hypothetical protein
MGCQNSKFKSATGTGSNVDAAAGGGTVDNNNNSNGKHYPRNITVPECSSKTVNACFGGVKVRYAFFSQRGYYPEGTSYNKFKLAFFYGVIVMY